MIKKVLQIFAILACFLLVPISFIAAATMTSTHYTITQDSINNGGDSYSTSTSYDLDDTVGEVGTGYSTSTNYQVSAGYWAASGVWISVSSTGNVNLGTIVGIGGATATGTASYVVTTNNAAGYQLTVQATTSPAMTSLTSSIPDYTLSGGTPDYNFTLASSGDARFGFNPTGTDILAKYKNNGSVCNAGSTITAGDCWDGFSTSTKVISQSSAANDPSGATTTVEYEVKLGSGRIVDSQHPYNATIIVTATTL